MRVSGTSADFHFTSHGLQASCNSAQNLVRIQNTWLLATKAGAEDTRDGRKLNFNQPVIDIIEILDMVSVGHLNDVAVRMLNLLRPKCFEHLPQNPISEKPASRAS
jgi:hypothetical protein